MGFKRLLLERERSQSKSTNISVMNLSENINLIRDGLHAAAAAAMPGSLKQFSDFSINQILKSTSDNDVGNYLKVNSGLNSKDKVAQTGMDLSNNTSLNFIGSVAPTDPRPSLLNRVFDSPWCSKGPIMFTPKSNTFNQYIGPPLKQALITVQQTAQSYSCYNYNPTDHHLNPPVGTFNNILYHSAVCRNGGLSKVEKGHDLSFSALSRDLDYYYLPTTQASAPPFPSSPVETSPYSCPCKQCEIRSLCTTPATLSLEDEAGSSTALFNLKARYECDQCGKKFSQLRNYKYHVSIHKGTKEFAAHCPECGKMFNDKGYLSSHLKIHRNRKEYVCPHCPKSFNQRVAFNMHVRIHTGIKPHKCAECGKRFSRKMLLKQHLRTHSGEKPYQCTICLKTFADRSNMTLHQRLHSGIKPFSCPICPKAFTKKHHLKTHLNYHTGFKPYKCPYKECGQCFTQSSNMRTHAKKCQFKPPETPSAIP